MEITAPDVKPELFNSVKSKMSKPCQDYINGEYYSFLSKQRILKGKFLEMRTMKHFGMVIVPYIAKHYPDDFMLIVKEQEKVSKHG